MANVDDMRISGWGKPPQPIDPKGKSGKGSHFRQFGLSHIMVLVVYCAILCWSIKRILDAHEPLDVIVFGVLLGIGFCLVGFWALAKMPRFSSLGWMFLVLGYLIVTGTPFFMAISSWPLFFSVVLLFVLPTLTILIGSIIFVNLRKHANNQDALLWVLEVATERGIPLAPGVQAFSGQVSGMFGVWTAALADFLLRGVPLPEALDYIPKVIPKRSALMVRMGWESGNLDLGLREAGGSRETRQPIFHAIGGRLAYIGWVAAILSLIVGFIMYFIVPKFEAIFKDFGLDLPDVTKYVIKGSHYVVDYAWLGTIFMLGAVIYGLFAMLGPNDLSIPIFDRLFPRRHMITILRALAIAVSAERPVPQSLSVLAQWYPTFWVRKRLNQSAEDSRLGVEWTEALRENGLLSSSDVGVLTSAQRAGNLAWALRELAETGERRLAYRLQAWSQILFVVTMLVLGFLVFVLAVAFMLPLITLIERLAS